MATQSKQPASVTSTDEFDSLAVNAAIAIHLEAHFRPTEGAGIWGRGPAYIRDQFRHEPGVLIENHPETMHKRG